VRGNSTSKQTRFQHSQTERGLPGRQSTRARFQSRGPSHDNDWDSTRQRAAVATTQDRAPDIQGKFNYTFRRQAITQYIFAWDFGASDQTFSDLLDSAKLIGKEEIDGHSCFKVDLGINTKDGKPQNRVTAWFDPEVNYWHRKIEIRPFDWKDGQPNFIKAGQQLTEYRILEFAQIEDAKTEKKRWFPKRCRMQPFPPNPVEIVIEDVKINHEIPLDRFIPDDVEE
jgi:hypothetical protein